jgi:hypothetical protein
VRLATRREPQNQNLNREGQNEMKKLMNRRAAAAVAGLLVLGLSQAIAQDAPPQGGGQRGQGRGGGRGGGGGGGQFNFDPEQMRQRIAERIREQLEIKNDDEWKAIEPLIEKVNEARREAGTGFGGMGFGGFGRRGGPGGGGGGGGGGQGGDANAPRPRNPFAAEPLPEAEALQKALDGQASKEELKDRMAKLREARKAKEAALEKAQDNLRKVLTVRQEAVAVVNGWLK